MAVTSLAIAARYGSNQGAGLHLPATVSRNTPAAETRQSMAAFFRPGMNGDDFLSEKPGAAAFDGKGRLYSSPLSRAMAFSTLARRIFGVVAFRSGRISAY